MLCNRRDTSQSDSPLASRAGPRWKYASVTVFVVEKESNRQRVRWSVHLDESHTVGCAPESGNP